MPLYACVDSKNITRYALLTWTKKGEGENEHQIDAAFKFTCCFGRALSNDSRWN